MCSCPNGILHVHKNSSSFQVHPCWFLIVVLLSDNFWIYWEAGGVEESENFFCGNWINWKLNYGWQADILFHIPDWEFWIWDLDNKSGWQIPVTLCFPHGHFLLLPASWSPERIHSSSWLPVEKATERWSSQGEIHEACQQDAPSKHSAPTRSGCIHLEVNFNIKIIFNHFL